MIIVWLGRLLTAALILYGTARVYVGFYVANSFPEPAAYDAATRRYIGSGTTGDAIDQGLIIIATGIVVGLVTRIASRGTN